MPDETKRRIANEHIGGHFIYWALNYVGSCSHLAGFSKIIEGDHVGNDTI